MNTEQLAQPIYFDIINLAQNEGWNTIIHFVPFNSKGMKDLSKKALDQIAMANRAFLLDHFNSLKTKVIDRSISLEKIDFLGKYSNSHCTQNAKKKLAIGVVETLQDIEQ